jgi:hypothetical protein
MRTASYLGVAILLTLIACDGRLDPSPPGASPGSSPGDAGTGGTQGSLGGGQADASGVALGVSIAPAAPQVCSGQCVDLTATATGGAAPYAYRWTGSSGGIGATSHVCPDRTTAYTVVAADSSGSSVELAQSASSGTATATVTVVTCPGDGGPAGDEGGGATADAGPPVYAPPASGLRLKCSVAWPSSSPINGGPGIRQSDAALAAAPDGGVVVGGSFITSIAIGGQTMQAVGSTDLLVAKLDSSCNVAWTRQIGARGAGVDVTAVAVGPDGTAIVTGYFQTTEAAQLPFGWGEVDFGTGLQTASTVAAFVVKLDTSGRTSWAKVYGGSTSGNAYAAVLDVAVDPSNDAWLAVRSDTGMDFASGAIPSGPDAGVHDVYLVELGPDGSLLSARPSAALAPSSWLIDSVDTAPDGTVWLGGTGMFDLFANNAAGSSTLHAVHVDAHSNVLSSQSLPATSSGGYAGAAVRVGPSGDAVVSATWPADTSGLSWGRSFEGLSASGSVTWTYPSLPLYGSGWNPAELARIGAGPIAWVAGEFQGSLALGATSGTLSSGGAIAVDLVALGASGNVVSGSVPASLTDSFVGDMTLDANGDVFLAGWAGYSPQMTFFVTKLGL